MYTFAIKPPPVAKLEDEIKTKFTNDKHRFITNLIFTSNWFQNQVINFLKPFGISLQQFNVLRILRGAGDWVTMTGIKELMIDKTPNTTRLSDKLITKGYVERQRSESDRRIVYLRISDSGLKLLESIDQADNSVYLGFMERLTNEEAKAVNDVFDKIRG